MNVKYYSSITLGNAFLMCLSHIRLIPSNLLPLAAVSIIPGMGSMYSSNCLVQYGLLHCYGTLMGPDYKLMYLDVHQPLLQTPLIQPVSTPLFSKGMSPDLFCPKVHCSQFRLAYATKDAKYVAPEYLIGLLNLLCEHGVLSTSMLVTFPRWTHPSVSYEVRLIPNSRHTLSRKGTGSHHHT